MSPIRTETLSREAATRRLAELGAQLQPQHSTNREHLYWSPTSRIWIKVKARRGGLLLEHYRGCQC